MQRENEQKDKPGERQETLKEFQRANARNRWMEGHMKGFFMAPLGCQIHHLLPGCLSIC